MSKFITLHWIVLVWIQYIHGEDTYSCHFEIPCKLLGMDSRWELTSGQYLPNAYSPGVDHTLASSKGHYLYTASFSSASGRVSFPVLDFSEEDRCLEFYYLMNAQASITSRMGNLKVWLSMGATDNVKEFWFDAAANSGPAWNRGFIPLPRGRYRIYFEAYLLDYRKDRIIGLDDITIHRCPGEGGFSAPNVLLHCDFEDPTACSLRPVKGGEFLWQRVSAKYGGVQNMPVVDHTTNSTSGAYTYSLSTPTEGAGKLLRSSLTIPRREPYCLDFYYKFSSVESAAKFYIYSIRNNNLTILWSSDVTYHVSEEEWAWAAIPMPPGTYDVTFELRSYDFRWLQGSAMFALDDVTVASCQLLKGLGSSLVQNNAKVLQSYLTSFECDFERGSLCGATVEDLCAYTWDVQPSWPHDEWLHDAPPSNQGYFLHFNGTSNSQLLHRRLIASLRLPRIWAYERVCLYFQFLMDTSHRVELETWITGKISPTMNKQLWVHVGSNGARWDNVLVALPYTDFDVHLRVKKEFLEDYATIGIDNVRIDSCEKLDGVGTPIHIPDITRSGPGEGENNGEIPPNDERYSTLPVPSGSPGSDVTKHNSPSSIHRYNSGPEPCNCNCTPACAQATHLRCNVGSRSTQTLPVSALGLLLAVFLFS